MSIRLGIQRPDRPAGPAAAVVADAEARVLHHEFARRLGAVTIDLRIEGDRIGPWLPAAHAAWPGDIDASVDQSSLWNDSLPPLTTLFGRTIEPDAAEVRRRMLRHLGVLPIEPFDDTTIDAWSAVGPIRPTDLWIALNEAATVDVADPAIRALRSGDDSAASLDAALDQIVDGLELGDSGETAARHLVADAEASAARVAELTDELARAERDAADRIDELLDELLGEIRVLREQVERADLSASLTATPES